MTARGTATGTEAVVMDCITPAGKSVAVRQVFEDTRHYLRSRRVDIRMRTETVRVFAESIQWQSLVDIGCGDGSISLPLADAGKQLTLLDLSGAMAALAQRNATDISRGDVVVRNEDFMNRSCEVGACDLVITVGVMAHLDSPDAFLGKIRSVLRPGGHLIIEFTDAHHFVGVLGRTWGRMKELVAPAKYSTNKLSYRVVASLFAKHHFTTISTYRYARVPVPGVETILGHGLHYRLAKLVFGDCRRNRNSRFGNEYICLLTAD